MKNGPNGPVSYSLGNGLSSVFGYDSLGRLNGGWACSGSTSSGCTGGTMNYGFTNGWKGSQLTGSSDSALNQSSSYAYDQFNRLASRTVTAGTPGNYTYVYDRWGNRWQQSDVTLGTATNFSFNTANNQITTAPYAYDAAGNMLKDATYTYTYDAEGNIVTVKTGATTTATYVYNALNQRVRTVVTGGATTEFVFNASGQRASVWNGSTKTQIRGQYYWGAKPVAYYDANGTHFQHQDWLGTERLRTTYTGAVEATLKSLPFGDGQVAEAGGDPYYFASLDYDSETQTDHAQFRQYSSTQGRWMSPDAYTGSYDPTNPQSMNRYAYVLNNPLSYTDPSGQNLVMSCDDNGNCTEYDDGQGTVDDGYGNGFGGYNCDAADTACVDGGDGPDIGPVVAPNNVGVYQNPCAYAGRALPPSAYAAQGQAANGNPINFALGTH